MAKYNDKYLMNVFSTTFEQHIITTVNEGINLKRICFENVEIVLYLVEIKGTF